MTGLSRLLKKNGVAHLAHGLTTLLPAGYRIIATAASTLRERVRKKSELVRLSRSGYGLSVFER